MSFEEFSNNLIREIQLVDGANVAFYLNFSATTFQISLPTLLLLHGINGSHFGMEFLAKELTTSFNLILIDLPGHGASEIGNLGKNPTVSNFQDWLKELLKTVHKITKNSELVIIAHSFGCYAVSPKISRKYPTFFICPVPTSSKYAKLNSKIMIRLPKRTLSTRIYNWTPFSALRGDLMLRKRSRKNRKRQHFVAESENKTSREFREFQAQFSIAAFYRKNFIKVEPKVVFLGKYDFVPHERTQTEIAEIFPSAKIYTLETGHLPTTEQPERLAELICENLL